MSIKKNINIEKHKLEHFLNTARKLKINGFIEEANEAEHKKVDNVNVGISPRNLPNESIEIKKGIDILNDIEDYVPVLKTDIQELCHVDSPTCTNGSEESEDSDDNEAMHDFLGLTREILTRNLENIEDVLDIKMSNINMVKENLD